MDIVDYQTLAAVDRATAAEDAYCSYRESCFALYLVSVLSHIFWLRGVNEGFIMSIFLLLGIIIYELIRTNYAIFPIIMSISRSDSMQ